MQQHNAKLVPKTCEMKIRAVIPAFFILLKYNCMFLKSLAHASVVSECTFNTVKEYQHQ